MGNDVKNNASTLKVGFKKFAIERPYDIEEIHGEYYGAAYYDKDIIKIADKYGQDDKNQTFIHEMLHCICKRFDLRALNDDEHSIELLATGIYEAILDNPHIFIMADM